MARKRNEVHKRVTYPFEEYRKAEREKNQKMLKDEDE